ncbi:MAG: sugar transferase [Bacteroidota bacterium]
MVKRGFDFFISILALLALLPFFLIIGLWIKMDSKGPVFYKQLRVGKNGILFSLFKFRTMHIDADKLQSITVGGRDPRITRAGYFFRKYKIDELPQLINVLKGDMSLVGPRPELKRFVDLYNPEQQNVLAVRPGITDYASIAFRNENEMLEGKPDPIDFYIREIMPVKLDMNLDYVRNQSFWLDLRIIFRTIFSIFKPND